MKIKTNILALCAVLTFGGLAAAGPITVIPTAEQLSGAQFAADSYNATAKVEFDRNTKTAFDAAQALLPVNQRTAYDPTKVAQYLPLTPEQYEAWRFSQVLDSHRAAQLAAAANDPKNRALFELALTLTPDQQAAVRSAIVSAVSPAPAATPAPTIPASAPAPVPPTPPPSAPAPANP